MNLMSRVAVFAISVVPMYAQAQQAGVVKLKAEAQNIVKIISGDKLKTQTYCEIVELDDEIDEEQTPLFTISLDSPTCVRGTH
jgi:hypothetical protein